MVFMLYQGYLGSPKRSGTVASQNVKLQCMTIPSYASNIRVVITGRDIFVRRELRWRASLIQGQSSFAWTGRSFTVVTLQGFVRKPSAPTSIHFFFVGFQSVGGDKHHHGFLPRMGTFVNKAAGFDAIHDRHLNVLTTTTGERKSFEL